MANQLDNFATPSSKSSLGLMMFLILELSKFGRKYFELENAGYTLAVSSTPQIWKLPERSGLFFFFFLHDFERLLLYMSLEMNIGLYFWVKPVY